MDPTIRSSDPPFRQTPIDQFGSLSLARAYVDTVRERIGSLGEGELIDALERLDHAYDEFPELESDRPRGELLEGLRFVAETMPDRTATPLLMYCVVASPCSSSLASLVEKVIKADYWPSLSTILPFLCRREFCWPAIEPIVIDLRQQSRQDAVVQLISELLGCTKFTDEASFSAFGDTLKSSLSGPHRLGVDSALLAQAVRSARRRLSRPSPARNGAGSRAVLLEIAERLKSIPSSARLSPYPDFGWSSSRMSFDEFLLQWPCEIELPFDLDDAAFIAEAYRAILLRGPDVAETDQYLKLLRDGAVSKTWIIEDLLASQELRSLERRVRIICEGQVITEPGSSGEEECPWVTWTWQSV